MLSAPNTSYANMFLSDRLENPNNTNLIFAKQSELEEIVFDYSKETSFVVNDTQNNPVQITKSILFDPTRCDLSGREAPPCTACIDSCEYSALLINALSKDIQINHQNCTACGKCVGACPTGSMMSAKFNLDAIVAILEASKGFGLLIAKECDLQVLNGKLPDDTLIVCVDNYSTLSELYLTIMALKTGGKLYFVDDSLLPEETKKSIIIANSFTQELFACDGMGFLNSSCESMSSFERVEKRVENLSLRTAFSECIKATDRLTQNLFATTSNMFATVSVDDRCTACMGCAFVCKSSAFVASEEQGALLLNASLCTACGFCESVCPEKSISVTKNQISLKAEDFTHKVVAKDELFYCVECGKAFATKKAIEKVAGVFATLFMEEHKKRTLFCCADCKPKIMLQDMINQNAEALA